MKLILFILINLPFLFAMKTFNDTIGCTMTNRQKLFLLKCRNVTWNNEETIIDLPSTMRNVTVNPFSPSKVWLDEELKNIIGMSDKDKFVIIWKDRDSNFTNAEKSLRIKELLDIDSYFALKVDIPTHHVVEKRDNLHLIDKETLDPSLPDFIGYLHKNVYNHQNILDWLMEQYFDDDKPGFSEMGYNATLFQSIKFLNSHYDKSKFVYPVEQYQYLMLCGDKMVEINFFEDLSHNEWRECVNPREFDPMKNITWHSWMWDALPINESTRLAKQLDNPFWLSEKYNTELLQKSLWKWLVINHRKY